MPRLRRPPGPRRLPVRHDVPPLTQYASPDGTVHGLIRNPSGHTPTTRAAGLPAPAFDTFYGHRGITINPHWPDPAPPRHRCEGSVAGLSLDCRRSL